MKHVHILLISCLLLCSCLFEEEAENEPLSSPSGVAEFSSSSVELTGLENEPLSSSSSIAVPSSSSAELENEPLSSPSTVAVSSSSSVDPSSGSVEQAEPSILDCPLEDLEDKAKYYPDPEFDPPNPGSGYAGWCPPSMLELSAEELSFNAQGGVRCVTARSLGIAVGTYGTGRMELGCYREMIVRLPDGSIFTGTGHEIQAPWKFKRLVCPWFTATNVDIWSEEGRSKLHISVNKNETGNERETQVSISMGNCGAGFKITQSN